MEILRGTPGPDELFAGTRDTLIGGAGNDTLDATDGGGGNRLFGQDGDDLLLTGSRDLLVGGAGNDQLFVGSGRGQLVGGAGADGFWIVDGELPSQVNVVRDFRAGTDVLGLRGLSPEEVRSLRVSQINPTDTLVQVAGENVAILRGVQAGTLTMDDFIVAEEPEPPAPLDSLLDEILDRGFLRVGVLDDVAGLSFAEEDGSFSGMGVDFSRAIATALFDDPDAVEYVVQEFADSFGNTADGTVDISAVAVHNLTRDASLDVDYSPIYLYDGVGVLVLADSGVTSVADLEDLTIGILAASTAEQALIDAADDAGVEINIESFPTLDEVFAAYDAGEVDGVSIVRSVLASSIPTLSDPDNQLILDEVLSKDPIGMLVPENESEWADVVRWVVYATQQAEESGINSENLSEFLETEDIFIREFLGLAETVGDFLGLENDWVINVIEEVGNYEEIYDRNFDTEVLPRGLNESWINGGLIYSPPFIGEVDFELDLIDNDDRNVFEEVLERGFLIVGTSDDRPGFGFEVNGELQGADITIGRAIAAAIFGDPNAVEFVIADTEPERFSDVANGIVDVTINGTALNLTHDGSLGVDFSPINIYDRQIIVARADSGITQLTDLEGQRVGVIAGTPALDNFEDLVIEELGLTFEEVVFDTAGELLGAFRSGDITAMSGDSTILSAVNVAFPEGRVEEVILDEFLSKEPIALAIDENQSEWRDVISWGLQSVFWHEELGITSDNVDDLLENSTDPTIRRLLGVDGDIGESLGLSDNFAVDIINVIGDVVEFTAATTGLDPFGLNEPWTTGGLFYALPLG